MLEMQKMFRTLLSIQVVTKLTQLAILKKEKY